MTRRLTFAALLTACWLALGRPSATRGDDPALPPDEVTVTLQDGRSLSAAVDARTDAATLWLRFDGPSCRLLRPIEFSSITAARYGGRNLSLAELRQLAPQLRSRDELPTADNPSQAPVSSPPRALRAEHSTAPVPIKPAVQTLQADAWLGHWTANTEVDGIVLRLAPLDDTGRLTPVHGTLSVELIGERRSHLMPPPVTNREQFDRLGSWTEMVRPEQFDGDAAPRFQLPFQAIDPQFDPATGNVGLLIVRLSVPGAGVFETAVADLRIRPLSRFRNRIEDSTGRRFLSEEQTGRPGVVIPGSPNR